MSCYGPRWILEGICKCMANKFLKNWGWAIDYCEYKGVETLSSSWKFDNLINVQFLLICIFESFVQIGLPLLYYLVIHYDALEIFLQLLLIDNFQRLLRSLDYVNFSLQLLNLYHLFLLFFEFQLFHGKVKPRRGAGSQNIIWSNNFALILLRHWASTRTLLGNIMYIVVDLFIQLSNLIALKLKVLFILSHLICIVLHFVNFWLLVP